MRTVIKNTFRGTILLASFILLHSCVKETFDVNKLNTSTEFTPGAASPVGYLKLDLHSLVKGSPNGSLRPDANGLLTFYYSSNLYSVPGNEFPVFRQVHYEGTFINDTPQSLNSGAVFKKTDTIYLPGLTEAGSDQIINRVDSIKIIMKVISKGQNNTTGKITMTFPTLKKDNSKFISEFGLTGNKTYDNNDAIYNLGLNSEGSNHNLIQVVLQTKDTVRQDIIPGDTISSFSIDFNIISWEVVYGYLGQHDIDLGQNYFVVDFYQPIPAGSFHFEDPRLKIITENSYGIPMDVFFNTISFATRYERNRQLTGSGVPDEQNPWPIAYPSADKPGTLVKDSIEINNNNSNLADILDQVPERMTFSAKASTNPDGDTVENSVTPESKASAKVNLVLPLFGYTRNLAMADTFAFQLDDFNLYRQKEINQVIFKFNFKNTFPAAIRTQLYFADKYMRVMDSVFEEPYTIPGAPPVDTKTDNPPAVEDEVNIPFSADKITMLRKASYIIANGHVSTTGSEENPPRNVKFFDNNLLTVHMGLIFDLKVEMNQF